VPEFRQHHEALRRFAGGASFGGNSFPDPAGFDFRSARSCHFVYPWRKSLISKIKTPKVEQANGFDSLPS
jgi:hypothetical protein